MPGSSAASVDHRKRAVTMYLTDIILKEHTKLKSSLSSPPAQAATSEAQTPSTSSAGADTSQPEPSPPLNKKLRLLENLDSKPEDEPVDCSGNHDIHTVLKEIAAYLDYPGRGYTK